MPNIGELAAIGILAYALGGVPTALLIGRLVFGVDIRQYGSGNVGSTNALRVFGWQWGVIVQIVDILKGVVAVAVLPSFVATAAAHAEAVRAFGAVAAVAGHCWSPWAGFRGGKGVNTAAGALGILAPMELLIGLGSFALALASTGYVSVGSLTAAVVVPASVFLRLGPAQALVSPTFWSTIAIAAIVWMRHRANLVRLARGTEYRFNSVWLIGRIRRFKLHD